MIAEVKAGSGSSREAKELEPLRINVYPDAFKRFEKQAKVPQEYSNLINKFVASHLDMIGMVDFSMMEDHRREANDMATFVNNCYESLRQHGWIRLEPPLKRFTSNGLTIETDVGAIIWTDKEIDGSGKLATRLLSALYLVSKSGSSKEPKQLRSELTLIRAALKEGRSVIIEYPAPKK